eukprot:scaffold130282_cov54-Phaeocystis_antarctica.AAC.2
MAALSRLRVLSRGRAPRPRAAANAEAPARPICKSLIQKVLTAGSVPAPSPPISRCMPSGPADFSKRYSVLSAGSTEPSVPSVARSAEERTLLDQLTYLASRSSLQLRMPALRPSAAATS